MLLNSSRHVVNLNIFKISVSNNLYLISNKKSFSGRKMNFSEVQIKNRLSCFKEMDERAVDRSQSYENLTTEFYVCLAIY